MISLKVLSTVAAMALVVPVVTPSESFAQGGSIQGGGGGAPHVGGGGGGPRISGGGGGDDAVAYCMQTYRSYDVRSGTYLGNDGFRHPCP